MTFPRTSRGGFFVGQSLTPAVQTEFAKGILASTASFVLHSLFWLPPSLRALHPFQPVLSLSFGFTGFRPQPMGALSKPNPKAQSTLNRKENSKEALLLSDFCRPQANGQCVRSGPGLCLTSHLSLAFIYYYFFSSKPSLSSYLLARPSTQHFRHIISFTQHTYHVKWML